MGDAGDVMVLQIRAYAQQIMHHRHADRLQMRSWPDAGNL